MSKQTINVNLYEIVSRAVESGIDYGWNRAHKHVDNPDENAIKAEVEIAIMNELSEVIEWGDTEDAA